MRLKLTHVTGPKKHVSREQEEHEVDECMQEHRLLECALQVVTCTEISHESPHKHSTQQQMINRTPGD